MKKQAENWLLLSADDDIKVAEKLLDSEELTNMIAFHTQQAIEKTFKAVLEEKEAKVPRTHDLLLLFKKVEKYNESEMDLLMLTKINEVYIDTRYPSDLGLVPQGKPDIELANKFYLTAITVHAKLKKLLEYL